MHAHALHGAGNQSFWNLWRDLTSADGQVPTVNGASNGSGNTQDQGGGQAQIATSDPVTLSDAGLALQSQDGNSANGVGNTTTLSPDFQQEEQLLTTLADKSLAAAGVISPADEANTQVTFNSLSYDVGASIAVQQGSGGQGAGDPQVTAEEDATFVGQGEIVTPSGQDYSFKIELQLGQSEQGSLSSLLGGQSASGASNAAGAPSASSGASSAPAGTPANLETELLQVLQNLFASSGQSGGAIPAPASTPSQGPSVSSATTVPAVTPATPVTAAADSDADGDATTSAVTAPTSAPVDGTPISTPGTEGASSTDTKVSLTLTPESSGGASSAASGAPASTGTGGAADSTAAGGTLINWDAVLQQSQSLFDLLDSLAPQSAGSVPAQSVAAT